MTTKDKLDLFRQLRDERLAEVDLRLLKEKVPNHTSIPRFSRAPKRFADDIQYLLLDVASKEEILKNRGGDGSSDTSIKASSKTSTAPKKKPAKKTSSKASTKASSKTSTKASIKEEEENTDDGSSDTLTVDDASKEEDSKKK